MCVAVPDAVHAAVQDTICAAVPDTVFAAVPDTVCTAMLDTVCVCHPPTTGTLHVSASSRGCGSTPLDTLSEPPGHGLRTTRWVSTEQLRSACQCCILGRHRAAARSTSISHFWLAAGSCTALFGSVTSNSDASRTAYVCPDNQHSASPIASPAVAALAHPQAASSNHPVWPSLTFIL